MNQTLKDLYRHQEWADAEHWQAFEKYPAAFEDKALLKRLHHIHFVQHAFLWAVNDQNLKFNRTSVEDFPNTTDLKNYAMEFHQVTRDLK